MTEILDKLERYARRPPVDVEGAILSLGLVLKKGADLKAGIAGHIRRLEGERFEIATTAADHIYRQRFTMAHELGHYVLHRGLIGSGVDDDTKYRSTETGEFYNREIDEFHERQANAFAASYLIPERLIREHLHPTLKTDLIEVAKLFQVSPSAMRWRLKNLGLISCVKDERPAVPMG